MTCKFLIKLIFTLLFRSIIQCLVYIKVQLFSKQGLVQDKGPDGLVESYKKFEYIDRCQLAILPNTVNMKNKFNNDISLQDSMYNIIWLDIFKLAFNDVLFI